MENKEKILSNIQDFLKKNNKVEAKDAISSEYVDLPIYDDILFGFSDVDDELFEELKKDGVVGEWAMSPREWLPNAKTVISMFFPFSEEVKKDNNHKNPDPSPAWLHGRIEGQTIIKGVCEFVVDTLRENGYDAIVPSYDDRFKGMGDPHFSSNWSERHVAYISGLGTFGLSKGIITEKGVAGRLASIVTNAEFEVTKRLYSDIYEYCNMCGACVKNCPPNAISIEEGKNHFVCSKYLDETKEKFAPRYGCGKCQVGVPCRDRIPKSINR